MTNIKANNISLKTSYEGKTELVLSVTKDTTYELKTAYDAIVQGIKDGKTLSIELKWFRKKRSHNANSYMWVVCQEIAEVIKSTKNEVYQKAIRDVGRFTIIPIPSDEVEKWISDWNSIGLGWFSEVADVSCVGEMVDTINYKGSSTFNTKQMSILIDHLVTDAKDLGIQLLSDSDIDLLKREWGK